MENINLLLLMSDKMEVQMKVLFSKILNLLSALNHTY